MPIPGGAIRRIQTPASKCKCPPNAFTAWAFRLEQEHFYSTVFLWWNQEEPTLAKPLSQNKIQLQSVDTLQTVHPLGREPQVCLALVSVFFYAIDRYSLMSMFIRKINAEWQMFQPINMSTGGCKRKLIFFARGVFWKGVEWCLAAVHVTREVCPYPSRAITLQP